MKTLISGTWDDVKVYPTTQMVLGEYTREQVLRALAERLYDEYVCDRRFSPEDVALMVLLHAQERNK